MTYQLSDTVLVSLILGTDFTICIFSLFYIPKVSNVLVRFDPTSYNTTETDGSVTVHVWVYADRVIEPFTVALIPGEGDVICFK